MHSAHSSLVDPSTCCLMLLFWPGSQADAPCDNKALDEEKRRVGNLKSRVRELEETTNELNEKKAQQPNPTSRGMPAMYSPPPPAPLGSVEKGEACKCSLGSGEFATFLRGNTCQLACASSWALSYKDSSPVSKVLANEPALIAKGKAYAGGRSLALCTVMREFMLQNHT